LDRSANVALLYRGPGSPIHFLCAEQLQAIIEQRSALNLCGSAAIIRLGPYAGEEITIVHARWLEGRTTVKALRYVTESSPFLHIRAEERMAPIDAFTCPDHTSFTLQNVAVADVSSRTNTRLSIVCNAMVEHLEVVRPGARVQRLECIFKVNERNELALIVPTGFALQVPQVSPEVATKVSTTTYLTRAEKVEQFRVKAHANKSSTTRRFDRKRHEEQSPRLPGFVLPSLGPEAAALAGSREDGHEAEQCESGAHALAQTKRLPSRMTQRKQSKQHNQRVSAKMAQPKRQTQQCSKVSDQLQDATKSSPKPTKPNQTRLPVRPSQPRQNSKPGTPRQTLLREQAAFRAHVQDPINLLVQAYLGFGDTAKQVRAWWRKRQATCTRVAKLRGEERIAAERQEIEDLAEILTVVRTQNQCGTPPKADQLPVEYDTPLQEVVGHFVDEVLHESLAVALGEQQRVCREQHGMSRSRTEASQTPTEEKGDRFCRSKTMADSPECDPTSSQLIGAKAASRANRLAPSSTTENMKTPTHSQAITGRKNFRSRTDCNTKSSTSCQPGVRRQRQASERNRPDVSSPVKAGGSELRQSEGTDRRTPSRVAPSRPSAMRTAGSPKLGRSSPSVPKTKRESVSAKHPTGSSKSPAESGATKAPEQPEQQLAPQGLRRPETVSTETVPVPSESLTPQDVVDIPSAGNELDDELSSYGASAPEAQDTGHIGSDGEAPGAKVEEENSVLLTNKSNMPMDTSACQAAESNHSQGPPGLCHLDDGDPPRDESEASADDKQHTRETERLDAPVKSNAFNVSKSVADRISELELAVGAESKQYGAPFLADQSVNELCGSKSACALSSEICDSQDGHAHHPASAAVPTEKNTFEEAGGSGSGTSSKSAFEAPGFDADAPVAMKESSYEVDGKAFPDDEPGERPSVSGSGLDEAMEPLNDEHPPDDSCDVRDNTEELRSESRPLESQPAELAASPASNGSDSTSSVQGIDVDTADPASTFELACADVDGTPPNDSASTAPDSSSSSGPRPPKPMPNIRPGEGDTSGSDASLSRPEIIAEVSVNAHENAMYDAPVHQLESQTQVSSPGDYISDGHPTVPPGAAETGAQDQEQGTGAGLIPPSDSVNKDNEEGRVKGLNVAKAQDPVDDSTDPLASPGKSLVIEKYDPVNGLEGEESPPSKVVQSDMDGGCGGAMNDEVETEQGQSDVAPISQCGSVPAITHVVEEELSQPQKNSSPPQPSEEPNALPQGGQHHNTSTDTADGRLQGREETSKATPVERGATCSRRTIAAESEPPIEAEDALIVGASGPAELVGAMQAADMTQTHDNESAEQRRTQTPAGEADDEPTPGPEERGTKLGDDQDIDAGDVQVCDSPSAGPISHEKVAMEGQRALKEQNPGESKEKKKKKKKKRMMIKPDEVEVHESDKTSQSSHLKEQAEAETSAVTQIGEIVAPEVQTEVVDHQEAELVPADHIEPDQAKEKKTKKKKKKKKKKTVQEVAEAHG